MRESIISTPTRAIMAAPATFKCLLLGDARSGKSAFIAAHLGANVDSTYIPAASIKTTNLAFKTTDGATVNFEVTDISGFAQHIDTASALYIGADCAIIAFNAADPAARVPDIVEWRAHLGGMPIVIIGTHDDALDARAPIRATKDVFFVSATRKTGLIIPFAVLAQNLARIQLEMRSDSKIPITMLIPAYPTDIRRKYAFTNLITHAMVELTGLLDTLNKYSGALDRGVAIECEPRMIIHEFAHIHGCDIPRMYTFGTGEDAIWHMLYNLNAPMIPSYTRAFINNIDREMLDFITARIRCVHNAISRAELAFTKARDEIIAECRAHSPAPAAAAAAAAAAPAHP